MIRKTTLFKRKLRSSAQIIFFSLLLFLGVFAVSFGIWFFLRTHVYLKSPLAKALANKNAYALSSEVERFCLQYHLNCTNTIIQQDKTITLTIDSDEEVIFSTQKNLQQQFTSLQLTIAHLTIEGKRFHRLDFRFDNPVISY